MNHTNNPEQVAVTVSDRIGCYHKLVDGRPLCNPAIGWQQIGLEAAERTGYQACEHCYGEVVTNPHSGLRKQLLEMDPDEVGV